MNKDSTSQDLKVFITPDPSPRSCPVFGQNSPWRLESSHEGTTLQPAGAPPPRRTPCVPRGQKADPTPPDLPASPRLTRSPCTSPTLPCNPLLHPFTPALGHGAPARERLLGRDTGDLGRRDASRRPALGPRRSGCGEGVAAARLPERGPWAQPPPSDYAGGVK